MMKISLRSRLGQKIHRWTPLFLLVQFLGCSGLVPRDRSSVQEVTEVNVEVAFPVNGGRWNGYLENNGAQFYQANDTACNADGRIDGGTRDGEIGGPQTCFHAGVIRKVSLANESSCDALSAVDDLAVLNWLCLENGGQVYFYSTNLNPEKRLSDLLNDDGDDWRENSISISKDSVLLYQSTAAKWWDNPVRNLDSLDNASAGTQVSTGVLGVSGVDNLNATTGALHAYRLDDSEVIYTVISSKALHGIVINADKISLVVYPDAELSATDPGTNNCDNSGAVNSTDRCLVGFGAKNYLWIEGQFDGDNDNSGGGRRVLAGQSRFSMFRHIQARRAGVELFFGSGFLYNRIYDLKLGQSISDGLNLENGSEFNVLHKISASNISENQILLSDGSNNILTHLQSTSGGTGVTVLSPNNTLSHINASNLDFGMLIDGGADQLTVTQLVTAHNSSSGISSQKNEGFFSQVASANNVGEAIELTGNDNQFSDHLIVGNNGTDCRVDALSTGNGLLSGDTDCSGGSASITLLNNQSLATTFVGQITNDPTNQNTADLNGSGFLTHDNVTDWFNFANPERAWGRGINANLFNAGNLFQCESGINCAIWDWRLRVSDSKLRNRNGAFVNGAGCPASVHGDAVVADQLTALANLYLLNASEIMEDGIGDDDGLCESDESCLYSPNLGNYQGHGTIGTCTFDDNSASTSVTGVTMHGYLSNGQ